MEARNCRRGTGSTKVEVRTSKDEVESECVEVPDGKGCGSGFVDMRFGAWTSYCVLALTSYFVLRLSHFVFTLRASVSRVVTHRALDSRSERRAKFKEDARAFLAEADIDAQEDRLNGVEPKSKSHVALKILQVDVASSGCDLSNVSKDGHV